MMDSTGALELQDLPANLLIIGGGYIGLEFGQMFRRFGSKVMLCGPPELAPDVAATLAPGVEVSRHIGEALRGADVVMVLRIQKERLAGKQISVDDYVAQYQVTPERLKLKY